MNSRLGGWFPKAPREDDEGEESKQYPGVWSWHNQWWFADETQNFVGPYTSDVEANEALGKYEP